MSSAIGLPELSQDPTEVEIVLAQENAISRHTRSAQKRDSLLLDRIFVRHCRILKSSLFLAGDPQIVVDLHLVIARIERGAEIAPRGLHVTIDLAVPGGSATASAEPAAKPSNSSRFSSARPSCQRPSEMNSAMPNAASSVQGSAGAKRRLAGDGGTL